MIGSKMGGLSKHRNTTKPKDGLYINSLFYSQTGMFSFDSTSSSAPKNQKFLKELLIFNILNGSGVAEMLWEGELIFI